MGKLFKENRKRVERVKLYSVTRQLMRTLQIGRNVVR